MISARPAIILLLAAVIACAPDLSPAEWLVDRPRIVAVAADAPEVSPGAASTYRALAIGPAGELDLSAASWSLCTSPLPLTESGSVAQGCLGPLASAGQGAAPSLSASSDACSLFGPIGSASTQRARDPDATGGYYQPVRVSLGGQLAFAEERLLCPLAQASFQVSTAFQQSYRANQNPGIAAFAMTTLNGDSVLLSAVPARAQLELAVSWSAADNERFPVFDPATFSLVEQTETMRVSWFATGGALSLVSSGADETAVASRNRWTAPATAGPVYLWAVLRDSRGGASWDALHATVTEAP